MGSVIVLLCRITHSGAFSNPCFINDSSSLLLSERWFHHWKPKGWNSCRSFILSVICLLLIPILALGVWHRAATLLPEQLSVKMSCLLIQLGYRGAERVTTLIESQLGDERWGIWQLDTHSKCGHTHASTSCLTRNIRTCFIVYVTLKLWVNCGAERGSSSVSCSHVGTGLSFTMIMQNKISSSNFLLFYFLFRS